VQGLLKKPSAKKVFVCSILPCHTDNALRDAANAATNVLLRHDIAAFSESKVVRVELEKPLRAIDNWQALIRLHPTREGYKALARRVRDRGDPDRETTAFRGRLCLRPAVLCRYRHTPATR
jgi:hypothetical protein